MTAPSRPAPAAPPPQPGWPQKGHTDIGPKTANMPPHQPRNRRNGAKYRERLKRRPIEARRVVF
ncbi:MAG: hypothetical protein JXQ73_33180 [Phycisphaerae bacterium]|nr:hypothetical protein [Phycisphaerae bacterium]